MYEKTISAKSKNVASNVKQCYKCEKLYCDKWEIIGVTHYKCETPIICFDEQLT